MQCKRKWPLVAAGILALTTVRSTNAAQPATQPTTRPAAISVQPADRFDASLTEAFSLPLSVAGFVEGLAWDGVNNGLWVIQSKKEAVLLDPVTGKEKRRISVPSSTLVGHDGVGLWLATRDSYRRIRTAPDLSQAQKSADWKLPEDSPDEVAFDAIRVVPSVPPASTCSMLICLGDGAHRENFFLFRCYFDLRTANLCAYSDHWDRPETTAGAEYLWYSARSFGRIPLESLRPSRVTAVGLANAIRQRGDFGPNRMDDPPATVRHEIATRNAPWDESAPITWDGQKLWSIRRAYVIPSLGVQPTKLISIDVGLTRKPDTTARYQKALAFERANGTLKALPVFEQIFTDDPSAAEIRNHVAWALAARPAEPYHNLDRALELVNEAIQWQPWNPEMWDTLAEIYWRKGDAKLAVRLEAKAINLNPHKTFYWRQYDKFMAGPATQPAPEPGY